MPDIFAYSDYRKFLKDYYEEQKLKDSKYSHRYFAMKVGTNSSGLFSDIMSGKRNLTGSLILKFAKALKLRREEENYFENLVHFNQAKNVEEKNRYYEKMMSSPKIKVEIMAADKHEFYSKWYYSAIRELLYFFRFKDDYGVLARKVNPSIKPGEARKAVRLLERLGMVRRDSEGFFIQHAPLISTGDDFTSLNVSNFQITTMDLAKEALDRYPKEQKGFSTLTMTLSEDSVAKAKLQIQLLRKSLLALAEQDKKVDRVYQFNFQLFPLSKF